MDPTLTVATYLANYSKVEAIIDALKVTHLSCANYGHVVICGRLSVSKWTISWQLTNRSCKFNFLNTFVWTPVKASWTWYTVGHYV